MQEGGPTTFVVKNRSKHPGEAYNREKLRHSIVAACISVGAPTGNAESIARNVTAYVEEWLRTRPEVTTGDIRRVAAKSLKTYHPDASYLYEHHRSTL